MPEPSEIDALIRQQLPLCIRGVSMDVPGTLYRGKVRDTIATLDGLYILVTTDRISAFDHVLRQLIPFKGQVLNQLSAHFFRATADIVPNHVLDVPDPNVTVARRCKVIPIEFVVRGYLAGHAWRVYRSGHRVLCGHTLPEGMRRNDRLATPLLTPATKASSGHDEDISREEILHRGILSAEKMDRLEAFALALFERGTELAAAQGLILVDTKYEFGTGPDGEIVLIDEIHTPDSSRYYYADSYHDLLERDEPQRQLSKEFVREWLMERGFQGKEGQSLPDMPDEFRVLVSKRYIELYERVTGQAFRPAVAADPETRIRSAIRPYLGAGSTLQA